MEKRIIVAIDGPAGAGKSTVARLIGERLGRRVLDTDSLIEDRPARFGVYAPENFDDTFHGTVTVRTALQQSLNVPALQILNAIGANIYHVGPAGAGNTIKAINNMMSTVNACAMMEGFAVGLKAGLDLKTMADIVKSSSGNSNALPRVDRALIPRNFEPGFKVALMNKDLDTFHAMAKELHVPVSFSNMAQHYQQAALAAGLGEKDTSVIFTLIEQRSALTPGKR